MNRITTTYQRVHADTGLNRGEPLTVSADVLQDSGFGFLSETLVIWTDETLALFAALELDAEELLGCEEAIENEFWEGEREACRVASVRQRQAQPVSVAS